MMTLLLILVGFLLAFSTPLHAQEAFTPITLDNVNTTIPLMRLGRGQPTVLLFSPDESLLAVGSSVGVWLYDMNDLDAEPRHLNMDIDVVNLAFSPAGGLLAVGAGDGTGRAYDLNNNDAQLDYVIGGSTPERGAMANYNFPTRSISFSTQQGNGHTPDGQGAISGTPLTDSDGAILYLHVKTAGESTPQTSDTRSGGISAAIIDGEVYLSTPEGSDQRLAGFTQSIEYATMDMELITAWVTDGTNIPDTALITIGRNMLRLWDVNNGTVIYQSEIDWTPLADTIAEWEDTTATFALYESSITVIDGGEEYTLIAGDYVGALDFRPDGAILAAGLYNGNVMLWDMQTREPISSQYSHFGHTMALDWSPDGQILYSGGEDNRVFAEQLTDDPDHPLKNIAFIGSHAAPVIRVWALEDGARVVSVSMDGTAIVWGVPN